MTDEAKLVTVEEYSPHPVLGPPTELIRGAIVELPFRGIRIGYLCARVGTILGGHVDSHELGIPTLKDAVVTQRSPDTVRIADTSFYSNALLSPAASLNDYGPTPNLVFNVHSPLDRLSESLAKVGEFLAVGVETVVLLDPDEATASVFMQKRGVKTYTLDDVLVLPAPLDSLRHTVRHWLGRALDR